MRDLNPGWKFHAGDQPHAAEIGFDDSGWQTVDLPHTWNAADGQDGGDNYRRGSGWYRRTVRLSQAARTGRRIYLQFDAASLKADVYVNGTFAGMHIGGFARFRFDVTAMLKPDTDNLIAVRVDNSRLGIPPTTADFTFYGGLYRGVSLLTTDEVQITTTDYASSGVYLLQQKVSDTRAEVLCRTLIENHGDQPQTVEIRTQVLDHTGAEVLAGQQEVRLASRTERLVEQPLMIDRPHLWNGLADPYLYQVRVELHTGGRLRDVVCQPLGLRYFHVDPDEGLFLNGRHIDLHGVNRHQDQLGVGWAGSEEAEARDFAIIRELGANSIRLAHYQQAGSLYDRCDRAGMVVWTEIPFINGALATAMFNSNAKQQLTELIRQNFNHPSIFFWGIGNETKPRLAADRLLAELHALVRQEDPTRLSTYATAEKYTDAHVWIPDVVAWNKYFGWYEKTPFSEIGRFLDTAHALHPAACIGVSEFGAGGSVNQHQVDPQFKDPVNGFHPEEYQALFHEAHWDELSKRRYLWCKYIWTMFDFAADDRNEGDHPGRNDKGLVTFDRKTRKDAFYFYQAHWTTEPVLHIASRRFTPRREPVTEVKVYSNAAAVELLVNGRTFGTQHSNDRIFRWPAVTLSPGENRIETRAVFFGQQRTDVCNWQLEPAREAAETGR